MSSPAHAKSGPGVSPSRIMGVATQYWQSALLLTAVKLDLFSRIPDGGISSGDLARESGFAPRQFDLLLNALAAHEFLEKRGGLFFNAADTGLFLDRKQPGYMGNALAYALDQYEPWGNLDKTVREGVPAAKPEGHLGNSPEKTRHFVRAMHERALQIGPALIAPFDLSGRKTLLDLGGGPGTLSVLLTRKYPGLTATVVDLPAVAEVARELVGGQGAGGSVKVCAGSYLEDLTPLLGPERFDAVLLSGQMHQESLADAAAIFASAKSRLKPGGVLYLVDIMTGAEKTSPRFAALFGLNMALVRPNGGVHARQELESVAVQTGLIAKTGGELPMDLPYAYSLFLNPPQG